MSTAHYVLSFVNDLKWPAFAGLVIFAFRKPIKGLCDRIINSESGSISGPAGIGINWNRLVDDIEKVTEAASGTPPADLGKVTTPALLRDLSAGAVSSATLTLTVPQQPALDDGVQKSPKREWRPVPRDPDKQAEWLRVRGLADDDPSGAVRGAYELAQEAVDGYKQRLLKLYADAGHDIEGGTVVLTSSVQDALDKLQTLRDNVAVLGVKPTPDEARSFVRAAQDLAVLMDYSELPGF